MGFVRSMAVLLFCATTQLGAKSVHKQLIEKCFMNCASTESCIALEKAPSKISFVCEKQAKQECGNARDSIGCLDKLTHSDRTECPKEIMNDFLSCITCRLKCEEPKHGPDSYMDLSSEEECMDKCSEMNECMEMDKIRWKNASKCVSYAERRCDFSDEPLTCLDAMATEQEQKCSQDIMSNLIPCLKCNVNCQKERRRSRPRKPPQKHYAVEICVNNCSLREECMAVEAMPWKLAKPCSKYAKDSCAGSVDVLFCLDSLAADNTTKCPPAVFRTLIPCMKCDFKCEEDEPAQKRAHSCFGKCANTKECDAMDKAPWKPAIQCLEYVDAMCETSNDVEACLDGLPVQNGTKCSAEMLRSMIPCTKCHKLCEEEKHGFDLANKRTTDDCIGECASFGECKAMDKTPWTSTTICLKFALKECVMGDEQAACLDQLLNVNQSKCSKNVLANLIPCLKCNIKCEERQKGPHKYRGGEKQLCINRCTETDDCKTVDSATQSRMKSCEKFSAKKCGKKEDTMQCLEKIVTMPDSNCPIDFRKKMITCMKCDYECEKEDLLIRSVGMASESLFQVPEEAKREKCLSQCYSTDECVDQKGILKSECKHCIQRKCGGNTKGSKCERDKIKGDCRSNCSDVTDSMIKLRELCAECKYKCDHFL